MLQFSTVSQEINYLPGLFGAQCGHTCSPGGEPRSGGPDGLVLLRVCPGEIVTLKTDQDPAVKLLQDLGMQIPPTVQQLRPSHPATRAAP